MRVQGRPSLGEDVMSDPISLVLDTSVRDLHLVEDLMEGGMVAVVAIKRMHESEV